MTQKALLQSAGDGTAVPAGYVGEKLDFTERFIQTVSNAWRAQSTEMITLNPGVYLIYGRSRISAGTGSNIIAAISTNANNDDTGIVHGSFSMGSGQTLAAGLQVPMMTGHVVVPSGSTQKLYVKAFGDQGTPNVAVTGFAVRIA